MSSSQGVNQYTAAGPATFGYDGRGNLASHSADGITTTYSYDVENRLVGAGGDRSVSLEYDPLGRLYRVSGGSAGTTLFLYDGDALVAEYDTSGAMVRRYAHGAGVDEPAALYEGAAIGFGNRDYYKPDERGSIMALVNADGTNRTVKTYGEYGNTSNAATGRFGYTGQAWVEELGL